MPDNIDDTYARALQIMHSWDMNAKEIEEWKKQYINEWAGEIRLAHIKEFTKTNPQVWFDEFDGMAVSLIEEANERPAWETL